ncbi:MAG TPA: cysteine desulfurase, partial [Eubacteriaceae bacterium]|nr:cysteine desulfurase [Eubacteriaceae bacterium]
VPCNSAGELQTEKIRALIRPKTKAVIMTHASNVCGTILELEKVGSICKEYNLFFMIDTAQTAGFIDVDFNKLQADAIAFTGHKSLLGPQGIGGFLANKRTTSLLKPLIDGGTGSLSDSEFQPEYMPDKFEAGTLNIPGIYGLHAALNYLFETGISTIREKERMLLNAFLEGTSKIKALNPIGQPSIEKRTAIASVDFPTLDNGMIAHELSKKYGILTRSGLHCAPSAHKTLGTFPKGTVRFSFGHFNTIDDIQYTLNAIRTITDC